MSIARFFNRHAVVGCAARYQSKTFVGFLSMDASTAVAIGSTAVATIIAVVVPWMAFRFALRQDHQRWVREQRAVLYVDLLTEAYAEAQFLEVQMHELGTRDRVPTSLVDLRLPPMERARLGARANIVGSRHVGAIFNRIESEASWATLLNREPTEGDRMVARVRIGGLLDELQAQVRREIAGDQFDSLADPAFREAHPFDRFVARNEETRGGMMPPAQPADEGL